MSESPDDKVTRDVNSGDRAARDEPGPGGPQGSHPPAPGATAPGAKKVDYWFTVLLTDPVAVPVVRLLARRRILTPDQVTIVALGLGILSGVLFAIGTRVSLLLGGVCFYLAFVADCVDGKLSRATGVTSDKGEALDHLADGGRRAAAALGISIYLWNAKGIEHNRVWVAIIYIVLSYFFWEISGAEKATLEGGGLGRWQSEMAKRRLTPTPGMPDVQGIVYVFGPISGLVIGGLAVGILMVVGAILLTVYRRLI